MGSPINTYMGMDAHEMAAKERAEKFVGRTELRHQIYKHCESEYVENNTIILTGLPGDGKTSLIAYVATKCMERLRSKGDFVFVHLVDSCAGSSTLSNMLSRLHHHLSMYVGKENLLQTTTDLRTLHVAHLQEVAMNNPYKKFVIFVDAVNQLSNSMQSHSMWWLPSRKAPKNLRVIISTLRCTGDTLENSLKRCPKAVVVDMPSEMLEDDCKEMVIAMLKRHNIELTTESNDPSVGNQMDILLSKRKTPLYLKAAVEGLRTKWIMAINCPQSEAYTIYIENLPLMTEELFEKLLDSWEGDFSPILIRWLMTIISLSRDGLKESMLTDLVAYVEGTYHIKFEYSIRTVLDFIRGYLSTESIDDVKFFHEEIRQVALYRYKRRNFVPEVHDLIVQFFLKHIKANISDKFEMESSYYEDCLAQVVYHQTEIRKFVPALNITAPQVSTYRDTLRNILFIKDRIVSNHEMELLNDFRDTSDINMDEDERTAISEWERFTQFCWPYIKEYPEWSFAYAVNRPKNSRVAIDTKSLLEDDVAPDVKKTFPLTWLNEQDEELGNGKTLRCVQETTFSCDVGSLDRNICAFGADGKAFLNALTTGDIVHLLKITGRATSVHFSPTCEVLWIGNNHGMISVWDVRIGEREQDDLKVGTNDVLMIEHVNEVTVVCGTGKKLRSDTIGTISVIDTDTHSLVRTWSTQLKCSSYCYHTGENCIVSGHDGYLIVWDMLGNEVKRFKICEYAIRSMCAHKELPSILLAVEKPFAGEIKTLDLITGECNTIALETGPLIARFDYVGDNIICTAVNGKTITIYDAAGTLLETIRIQGGRVNDISPLPYLNSFISSANDGGKLHIRSTTPVVENTIRAVIFCEVLGKNEFVTLSEDGELSIYCASSLELRAILMVKFETPGWRATVHPSGELIVVCTMRKICVVDALECEILHISRIPNTGEDCIIVCAQFCPRGDKCIVATRMHGTYVYSVSDMHTFEHHLTYTSMKDSMRWCDIIERTCVSCGDGGIVLWDIDTRKTLQVLRVNPCNYVKILDDPKRLTYNIRKRDADDKKHGLYLMDLRGRDLMRFNTNGDIMNLTIHVFSQKYLITAESDGTFRLHDLQTGEVLYVFVDEDSLAFNAFMENPVTKVIHCYNQNGRCYMFKQTLI